MVDKVLVGKNTFISFGLMSSIIGATMFVSGIKEKSETNSTQIVRTQTKLETLRDNHGALSTNVNSKLSKIEGKLDILIQRVTK